MKKGLALGLSLLLLFSSVPACAAVQWPQWAEEAKQWAEEEEIGSAFLNAPNAALTRAQTAELLYEAAGRPEATGGLPFSDVSGEYAKAVSWAAENGFIHGCGDGTFRPGDGVTRQEFAVILYQKAGAPTVFGTELQTFADRASMGSWAETAMLWSVKTGLLAGKDGGRLAPLDGITTAEAAAILQRASLLPDFTQLEQDLNRLSGQTRPIGSEGEAAADAYLQERFAAMGYEMSVQPYTNENGKTGSNIIAVRKAEMPDADILVLSAHHDSVPTAYGANDNASGVTALLAVAEACKELPSDTELRLISFTDEENGKNGSRAYTASLSEEEKSRMIGDIQFDMLGGLGAGGLAMSTTDGEGNWITGLLRQKDAALPLAAETASDHTTFQLAGVPSVLLMQNGRGYLYHSAADRADQIDLCAVANAVRLTVDAVGDIVSEETPSYQPVAREQGNGYTYRQTRQTVIYFGSSLADSEAFIGAAGELAEHSEIKGNGWVDVYDTYLYSMRWFGGETPMNTYYRYRNGFLEGIEIRPEETGYTAEQVNGMIRAMYGEPKKTETKEDGTVVEGWEDPIYSKYLSFSSGGTNGCTVNVGNFSAGLSNVLATYPVKDSEAEIENPQHAAVWDYLCSILPKDARARIGEFRLFTDGCSNVLAFTSPVSREDGSVDNSSFSISIDYYDVYDENGTPRDWSKLTYTILHEYGHALLEDNTQIDLTVGENTHDPKGFIEGSFRKAFYDRFWKDLGDSAVGDYEKNPTNYVSRYGANYFHEDIADTFAVFVLGGKPEGSTIAEQKLQFFWDDAQMVALRSAVRHNLGLPGDR